MRRELLKWNVLSGLALALILLSIAAVANVGVSASAVKPSPTRTTEALRALDIAIPVKGVRAADLQDTFEEGRGKRRHEAIDILAPRGTPVIAAGDGRVAKLFRSLAGGITVYQFDASERFAYYYAHLDRYAEGLKEGAMLKRGDVVGYVGTTGNAPKGTPHLHFGIFRLGPEKRWWQGEAVNPYPLLARH